MKKITIITGHYGSGKTNLAVNLALQLADAGEKVTIVDFDIVNPYFRTADFAKLFEERGVTLAASMYANTSLDIPAISFDMERMAYEPGYLIVDVGGDDAGAIGLGRYAEGFSAYAPDQLDLWYVVNRYRYLTEEPGETLKLMYEIEAVSRMRHTGIVNNSNLGKETTADTVLQAVPYAEEIAAQAKLPLVHLLFQAERRLPESRRRLHRRRLQDRPCHRPALLHHPRRPVPRALHRGQGPRGLRLRPARVLHGRDL